MRVGDFSGPELTQPEFLLVHAPVGYLITVAYIYTVAFHGVEARDVDVRVHIGDQGVGQTCPLDDEV